MGDAPGGRQGDAEYSPGRRAWGLRVILLLGSVSVALIAFEVALRFVGDAPWYERLVDEQLGNEVGRFRVGGKEFKVRRPLLEAVSTTPETYRVLFLGDSFTYGLGVPDEESIFPTRVMRALREKRGENWPERFDFYNGGIPGGLTRRWVRLYNESVKLLAPDLVVAVFFLRDGTPRLGSIAGLAGIREAMHRYREDSFLFSRSHLYRLLVEQQKQRELGRKYFDSVRAAYLGFPQETREWQRAKENLLFIRDDTLERGGEFVLVIFPVLFALEDDYPLQAVVDEIQNFGKLNDIPTLSLLPAFLGEDASGLWISPLDQHPNERGHAIAADAITEFLAEQILETENRASGY